MILTLILMAAALWQEPPKPAAPEDPEAVALAELRDTSRSRCETAARPDGESVEACTERRTAAMLATYGSASDAPRISRLGFNTHPTGEQLDAQRRAEEAAVRDRQNSSTLRCQRSEDRREDEYETSASYGFSCSSGGPNEGAAREMLDRLMNRERPF
jgi:hypothetical protein